MCVRVCVRACVYVRSIYYIFKRYNVTLRLPYCAFEFVGSYLSRNYYKNIPLSKFIDKKKGGKTLRKQKLHKAENTKENTPNFFN